MTLPDLSDATWLAQAYDHRTHCIRLVEMNPAAYRAAPFLDDRMLGPSTSQQTVELGELERALGRDARQDCAWIFHIGHVGSTLLSRMLGQHPALLGVREPRLLRDIAQMAERPNELIELVRKLLSRTFSNEQRAVVKATSFVSQLADRLPAEGGAAIALYLSPRSYLETILAGPASQQEIVAMAPSRRGRLLQHGIASNMFAERPEIARLVAESWVCEMVTLESSVEKRSDVSWLWGDFDRILDDLSSWLANAAAHFGKEWSVQDASAIAAGPLSRKYSKATEYDYSPELRDNVRAQASAQYGTAIASALDWIDSLDHAMVGRAIERVGRGN